MAFLEDGEGLNAEALFSTCLGYNFDDLALLPGPSCGEELLDFQTFFSKRLELTSPLVAPPIDTITGSRMAIAMAQMGGIGIISDHCAEDFQAQEVTAVKKYQNGFIMDPLVMNQADTIEDLEKKRRLFDVSTALICEGGTMGGKLLGIVTARDIDFASNRQGYLREVMTPKARLSLGREPISLSEAVKKLVKAKKGKLPIVNESEELVAVVARSDVLKYNAFRDAATDANRQLLVAAAASPLPEHASRIRKLVDAGVDALVLTCDFLGDTVHQIDFCKRLKNEYPSVDIVCGNVVTAQQAKTLVNAGADAIRVGMGDQLVSHTGVRRPEASAVYHVARYALNEGVPSIADGGARTAENIAMALSLGASSVMIGSLLPGTREAPGEAYFHSGALMKTYRGLGAMGPPATCAISERGSVLQIIPRIMKAVCGHVRHAGGSGIQGLQDNLFSGVTKFQPRSPVAGFV
jgi:IMP dehydrogenase